MRIGVGDVFAEHADALVERHLLVQRQPDRLAEGDERRVGIGCGLVGQRGDGRRRDHVIEHADRLRPRSGEGGLGGRAYRLVRVGAHRLDLLRGERAARDELVLEHDDRIVRGFVGQLLGAAVLPLVVGERVRVRPRHQRVHEARPAPARTCAIASAPLRRTSK